MRHTTQKTLALAGWATLLLASLACAPVAVHQPRPAGPPNVSSAPLALSIPDRSFPGQEAKFNAVAFDPSGRYMVTGDEEGWVTFWDFALMRPVWRKFHPAGAINAVAFLNAGKLLAAAGRDGAIHICDVSSGDETKDLPAGQGAILALAAAPGGRLLASAGTADTVKLWDPVAGKELRALSGHTGPIFGLAFSPDGKILASAGADKTVRLWEPDSGRLLHVLQGHTESVRALSFDPAGSRLASGSAESVPLPHVGEYKLWDADGRNLRSLSWHYAVSSLAFSPDGKILAIASMPNQYNDWCILFFRFDQNRFVERIVAQRKEITAIAFTPDGSWLVSIGADGVIRCWRSPTPSPRSLPA